MPEASHDPLVGTVLDGRYRIMEHIGSGGMSVVYRAEQVNVLARDVAVKLLQVSRLGASSVTKRFENEARIIAQLRHPNTLKLIDSGKLDDGRMYLVTEFLSGASLNEVLERGALAPQAALAVLRQVADSVVEAHQLGIVHRDLKPSNIMIERVADQEIVKVLDFGIAKLVDVPGLTAPAQICGTPGYMAPEQILGRTLDGRADIYSLGVVAYYALSGRPVFEAPAMQELLMCHARDPAPALPRLSLPAALGSQLAALVASMLEKDPEDRPRTMAEVRAVLADLEQRLRIAPVPPGAPAGEIDPYGATVVRTEDRTPTRVDPRAPGEDEETTTAVTAPSLADSTAKLEGLDDEPVTRSTVRAPRVPKTITVSRPGVEAKLQSPAKTSPWLKTAALVLAACTLLAAALATAIALQAKPEPAPLLQEAPHREQDPPRARPLERPREQPAEPELTEERPAKKPAPKPATKRPPKEVEVPEGLLDPKLNTQ